MNLNFKDLFLDASFLRFAYEKLSRRLRKIYSLAMPQISLLDVNFATMLQRYEFFLNCASF